jgi:rhodanese-related sulfurtransferase
VVINLLEKNTMKMMLAILLLGLSSIAMETQAQVKSKSTSFTLKMLLARSVPEITIADAAKNINNYLFLDAREQKEYNVSHLPNTRFVGYNNFTLSSLTGIAKDKPLVIYCSIGKRSENITRKLKKAGYTNIIIYTAAFLNG